MRSRRRSQSEQAREALPALLADRVECTPGRVAGTRGYAFTGDGTFGGLLANSAWPTTWWPQRVTIAFGTYKSAEF